MLLFPNILISTIDGNIVFVHSQYSCILTSQVLTQIVSDKIIDISDNFGIKSLSYSEKGAIFCVIYFLFLHFLFNLEKHVKLCDKISFSLLYLTLVTSCIIDPFLCCHLLYLIIYLVMVVPLRDNLNCGIKH